MLAMICQEPTLVAMRMAAPIKQASVDVSPHRPGNRAQESLRPSHRIGNGRHAIGRRRSQRGSVRKAINRDPNCIASDLDGIGKIEKSPPGQRWIEEVFAGAAEDLFTYHYAETNANSHLPQGNRRRQGQGKEHARDQEALIDLVLANHREKPFHKPPTILQTKKTGKK